MGFSLKKAFNKVTSSTPFKVVFPVQALAQGVTKAVTGMSPWSQYSTGAGVGAGLWSAGALGLGAAGGVPSGGSGVAGSAGGKMGFGSFLNTFGPSLLNAGSNIFSSFQMADSQRDANAANEQIAREQMAFSADQAARQMEFQDRMSSTAHRREVEDLKLAGLNPLLSVNSGASSPGGAAGSAAGYTAEPIPPIAAGVMTSAMEARRFQKEMKLMDEQINNARETGWNTRENTEQTFEHRRGLRLENDFLEKRNKFFNDHPTLYKLNAASGGINSAGSILRLLK